MVWVSVQNIGQKYGKRKGKQGRDEEYQRKYRKGTDKEKESLFK